MISIITSCVNREFYLKRLIDSMRLLGGYDKIEFEHFIIFQGNSPSDKMRRYLEAQPFYSSLHIGQTEKIESIGSVLISTIKKVKYPIIFKLDDDCALMSMDFLPRAYELCQKMPRGIIYPAIVDGELPRTGGNPIKRQSVFLKDCNVYITIGEAVGVSGKYLLPTDFAQNIPFQGQKDPQNVAVATLTNHLPIFQVLNGLVIEIQEGLSGQHHRSTSPTGQQI